MFFAYTWGPQNDLTFSARPNDVYELYDFMIDNGTASATVIGPDTFLSKTATLAPNTTDTPLTLGSRFTATCWGDVAEVIVFNRALTPPEMMGVEAYLRAKWLTSGAQPVLSAGAFDVASGAFVTGRDCPDHDQQAETAASPAARSRRAGCDPGGDDIGHIDLTTDTVRSGASAVDAHPTVPATASSSKAACRSPRPF